MVNLKQIYNNKLVIVIVVTAQTQHFEHYWQVLWFCCSGVRYKMGTQILPLIDFNLDFLHQVCYWIEKDLG